MKVTIELTDAMLQAIAEIEAFEHAYDVSMDSEHSAEAFYAKAFFDGASFILEQLNSNKNYDTSNS